MPFLCPAGDRCMTGVVQKTSTLCIHVKSLFNLGRAIKAKYVTLPVRVVGRKQGHGIWVYTFEVKKGGKYKQVWSFEEQQEIYRGGN